MTDSDRPSRLHDPVTGKLSLKKVGGWAASISAIIGLLVLIGTGIWNLFTMASAIQNNTAAVETCVSSVGKLSEREEQSSRALAQAIRNVDSKSKERDGRASIAITAVQTQVNTLHGHGSVPRSRVREIQREAELAVEAAEIQPTVGSGNGGDSDPLAGLEGL